LTGAYAGATVTFTGSNLVTANQVAGNQTPVVTIGGQAATIVSASPSQLTLQIPALLSPGPATLALNNGVASAYPVAVNIDTPPATITGVQNGAGTALDATHTVRAGDVVTLILSGFAPQAPAIAPSRVQVSVGGALFTPLQMVPIGSVWQVIFVLDATAPAGPAEPTIVYLDGRSSLPATIPVTLPSGAFGTPASP
jgi:uncharacterized protein (TIGR03437 family)